MIQVADTDILSMFGKVESISTLKRLFKELKVPSAVYEELLRAKEVGFSFVDDVFTDIEVINLSEDEH
jgi:predicted nucleic acid-binding protein